MVMSIAQFVLQRSRVILSSKYKKDFLPKLKQDGHKMLNLKYVWMVIFLFLFPEIVRGPFIHYFFVFTLLVPNQSQEPAKTNTCGFIVAYELL